MFIDDVSLTNNSVRSNASNISTKSLKIIVSLEEQHHREVLLLKQQIEDAKRSRECGRDDVSATSPGLDRYLIDCATHMSKASSSNKENPNLERMHNDLLAYLSSLCLHKVELSNFDGNPVDYIRFVKQFQYFVESEISDTVQRLLQLLYYCRGRAKDAVKECVILEPTQGYARAHAIVKELFGRSHLVAQSMINDLLTERKSVLNADALFQLAIKMQNCHIALKEMQSERELDAPHILESIVRIFPISMLLRCADEADCISKYTGEPSFTILTDFLLHRSRVASSRYGQLTEKTVSASRSNIHQREQIKEKETREVFLRAFTMLLNRELKQDCRLCKQANHLKCCPNFLELERTERWAMARRIGIPCGEFGCTFRHHALLHRTDPKINVHAETRVIENANICIATHSEAVRLSIIPVKVKTPTGLVETLAFLDTGLDTTLVKQQFMKDHNIMNKAAALTMTTLKGTTTTQCFRGSLKLYSWDERNSEVVDESYSVKDILVRPTRSVKDEAKKWPHLQDIRFDELPSSEVTVLISCDVPEAHRALEQRVNMKKQPYAIKTLLGWVMCGSLNKKEMDNTFITNIHSANDGIDDRLGKLCNNEFSDTSDRTFTRSLEDCYAMKLAEIPLVFVGDCLEVPLPLKESFVNLPDKQVVAERRILFLRRCLLRDTKLCVNYEDDIRKYVEKSYL